MKQKITFNNQVDYFSHAPAWVVCRKLVCPRVSLSEVANRKLGHPILVLDHTALVQVRSLFRPANDRFWLSLFDAVNVKV